MGFFHIFQNIFWFLFDISLNSLSDNIFYGKIDGLLTKPIGSKFLASFNEFDIASIPNALFGLAVFFISIIKLKIVITFLLVLKLLILAACSVVVFYSIFFIVLSLAFWAGRMESVRGFLHTVLNDPGSIPSSAYQGAIRFIASFIIPVALVTTVPTSVIFFNNIDWPLTSYYVILATVFYLGSNLVWKLGLKSYSSVSS